MKNKINKLLKGILIFFIPIFIGCNTNQDERNAILNGNNPFQTLIDSLVSSDKSVPGIILHIESPDLNISWTGTSGVDQLKTGSNLKIDQPFRIASITKTYVAVTVLLLAEQEVLSLNDSIGTYLSKEHLTKLINAGYQTNKITIRNLLNHTHGIFDYAMSDHYFQKINEAPEHIWTRSEQIEVALQYGKAQGKPGEQFYYSDTGYILMGEIIESVTGKSLARSLRNVIGFNKLGLNSTWTEFIETAPKGLSDIVHPYFNGTDFYNIHPSIDLYGGGGLVATASDVAHFFQPLFNNQIFKKPTTLETMLTKTILSNGQHIAQDYRMGIQVIEINGYEVYYHSGIWGSIAAYIPKLNSTIVINFTSDYKPEIIVKSVLFLDKLKNK